MSNKRWPTSEGDIARPIIAWLEERGWDVYQEVEFKGPIADIVAVLNNIVWVIECKRNFGLKVIEQAEFWRKHAHIVSISVPKAKSRFSTFDGLGLKLMKDLGIGGFTVKQIEDCYDDIIEKHELLLRSVKEETRPKLLRLCDRRIEANSKHKEYDERPSNLISALLPEHKTFAEAGSCNGGHFTEFKSTCQKVKRAVEKQPGIYLKELINEIDHHYSSDSSAKTSLSMWVDKGKVPGVKKIKDGKLVRFYPTTGENA